MEVDLKRIKTIGVVCDMSEHTPDEEAEREMLKAIGMGIADKLYEFRKVRKEIIEGRRIHTIQFDIIVPKGAP